MKARFVHEFLNEELLGDMTVMGNDLEVYKNPKSVKRMDYWARSVSTDTGDFYVMTLKKGQAKDTWDEITASHTELSSYLDTNHVDIHWLPIEKSGGYGYYEGGIAWQRYNNSDKWFISESTEEKWIKDNMDYIKAHIDKINKHNIHYLKLIPMRITKTYDSATEFHDADEYYKEQENQF